MRLIFSIAGLLVVALCVLLLARSQLQAINPVAAPPAAQVPGSPARAPADPVSASPATLPRQVQQDVGRSLEQGMAARASAVAQ